VQSRDHEAAFMHLRERVFRICSGFQNPTWQPGAVSGDKKTAQGRQRSHD